MLAVKNPTLSVIRLQFNKPNKRGSKVHSFSSPLFKKITVMKKSLLHIALFFSIFLIYACKKEVLNPTAGRLLDLANNFKFKCSDTTAEYYFKGFLDNQRFCYFEGLNNYTSATDTWIASHTSGTTLNVGDTSSSSIKYYKSFSLLPSIKDTACLFYIYSPYSSDISKVDSLLRMYFKQKGNIPLRKFGVVDSKAIASDSLSFDLSIWVHNPTTKDVFAPLIWVGDQTDSYIKITDVQELLGFEVDIYSVTFQINCKLYARDAYDNFILWRTLHDAETRLRVVLPHHD